MFKWTCLFAVAVAALQVSPSSARHCREQHVEPPYTEFEKMTRDAILEGRKPGNDIGEMASEFEDGYTEAEVKQALKRFDSIFKIIYVEAAPKSFRHQVEEIVKDTDSKIWDGPKPFSEDWTRKFVLLIKLFEKHGLNIFQAKKEAEKRNWDRLMRI